MTKTPAAERELQELLDVEPKNPMADSMIKSIYNIAYSRGYRDGLGNALASIQEGKP